MLFLLPFHRVNSYSAQVEPPGRRFGHLAAFSPPHPEPSVSPVTTLLMLCGDVHVWGRLQTPHEGLHLLLFVASLSDSRETFNKYLLWKFIKLC